MKIYITLRTMILLIIISILYSCSKSSDTINGNYKKQKIEFEKSEEIKDQKLENLHLFIFDENENMYSHKFYSRINDSVLSNLITEKSSSIILAVFNVDQTYFDDILKANILRSGSSESVSLSYLINLINDIIKNGELPDIIVGISKKSDSENSKTIVITISANQIKDNFSTVILNLNVPSSDYPEYTTYRSRTISLKPQFIVEAFKKINNQKVLRKKILADNKLSASSILFLPKGEYNIYSWCDYTDNNQNSLFYDISDIRDIKIASKDNYKGNITQKDCFCGKTIFSVDGKSSYTTKIDLYHPMAKYRIVSTDLSDYEKIRVKRGLPPIDELIIDVTYNGYFPSAYNMSIPCISGSSQGYKYTTSVYNKNEENINLVFDYVFTDASSSVNINLVIHDTSGNVISSIRNINIKYKQSCLTTIYGNFLTAGKGGVDIDTSWGDDINVNF